MIKNKTIIIKIIYFLLISIAIFYFISNKKIQKKAVKESYYYFKISFFLDKNDTKTAKFYSKKILKNNNKNIYYEMSCFILHNLSFKKEKKYKFYEKIIRDKNLKTNKNI